MTFPGAGVAALAASEANIRHILTQMAPMAISADKMNQMRHVSFLKNKAGVLAHMEKHRAILEPKFELLKEAFARQLTPCGAIARWTSPKGGYFISLYVMDGCAKRVVQLCKEAGVILTPAGSAYPTATTRRIITSASLPRIPRWPNWIRPASCFVSVFVWPVWKNCCRHNKNQLQRQANLCYNNGILNCGAG